MGTLCTAPTGVGRFISTILAGGGMLDSLEGAGGRVWVVEVACGVLERSSSVPSTSKWPADCDKSTSIVRDRWCFWKRLWLVVLARDAVLLCREIVE